ncbi:MAG: hypothetical protein JOZ73_08335 [Solirubrobacterales bacterium]|nr:hypothetical protein [Solirubrobacterales bacterium]
MAVALAVAVILAVAAGVKGVAAVPAVVRTAVVEVVFCTVCGWAPARLLVQGELALDRPLFVLPIGAAVSSLALTLLGLVHVPLAASTTIVVIGSLAAMIAVGRSAVGRRPGTGPPGGRRLLACAAPPLAVALLVGLVSLLPIFRAGFATTPGQNPDVILVVGSAKLLQKAPPTARRDDLPINHMPLVWRSKYPIYYQLAAVSLLAGQDPNAVFPTLAAFVLALGAIGFFLLARHMLRAPPWVALAVLLLVGIDRIVLYVTIHPYYNELWASFTLPFILLLGWRYLSSPSRVTAAMFALFTALGLLVYPLMLPFPAIFLGGYAWLVYRRRRVAGQRPGWIAALSLPQPRKRPWLWLPIAILAIPVAAVLIRGVVEKLVTAGVAIAPGGDLIDWRGGVPYFPLGTYVGLPGGSAVAYLGLGLVFGLALLALQRIRSDTRRPLRWMVLATALAGIYFRERTYGQLFDFRDLAFLGPIVLMLAVTELGSMIESARRVSLIAGLAGLLALLASVPVGSAREINHTFDNASRSVLQLGSWSRLIPRGASIRNDIPPIGLQLWATYMLHDHRLSALYPLGGFYPHPPRGRKADYVVSMATQPRPADAIGAPLLANAQFELWRMNPAVPGPDLSRRGLIDDYTRIYY